MKIFEVLKSSEWYFLTTENMKTRTVFFRGEKRGNKVGRAGRNAGLKRWQGRIRYAQPFPPYNLTPLNRLTEPTPQRLRRKKSYPNICQVFILYSAWDIIVRPPKDGSTREAGLEKRQQRSKGDAILIPLFLPAKTRERDAKLKKNLSDGSDLFDGSKIGTHPRDLWLKKPQF